MSFSSKGQEVATRAGVVQTAAGKSLKTTREADAARDSVYHSTDSDEAEQFGNGPATPSTRFSSDDKRIARRQTRRRRSSETENRRRVENSELSSSRATAENGKAKKAEKKAPQGVRRDASWTADRGLRTAQDTLHQQSLMQQASLRFEQDQRQNPPQPLSGFGQQQAMLDSLINMTEVLYQQHTGDKAGEIYNRPATRQILGALRGLKDAAQPKTETDNTEVAAPRRKKKKEFRAQMERLEKMQHVVMEPIAPPADYEPLNLVA